MNRTKNTTHLLLTETLLLQNDAFQTQECRSYVKRIVNSMFAHQIGRTMEVYVDNMLVKSTNDRDHRQYLAEMFEN